MENITYRTFIENDDTTKYDNPTEMPDKVSFKNLLNPLQDYFEIGIKCKLENSNEPVIPSNCTFYLTNDMKDKLYNKIYVKNKCLTKQNLAYKILDWLIVRNAYYNIRNDRAKKKNIHCKEYWKYARHLSVHGIKKTDETKN